MKSSIIVFTCLLYTICFSTAEAQQSKTEQKNKSTSIRKGTSNKTIKATTEDGRKVSLKSDGTWEFAQASSREKKLILPESASKALYEFAKIAGSTELDVEYDEYKSILIGFKATVNQAYRDLPEGSLRYELKTALSKYERALALWDHELYVKKSMKDIILLIPDKVGKYQDEMSNAMSKRYDLWDENRSSLERANELSNQYEPQ